MDPDFDPDGYGNDPSLEELINRVSAPFDLPARPSKRPSRALTTEEVDARLEEQYGGRIVRDGPYLTRQSTMRCRCLSCGDTIYKRAETFFRGSGVKCSCTKN